MGFVTNRTIIGNASTGNFTLDVSGNILIDSLMGVGNRSVISNEIGVLSTIPIPNSAAIDASGLVGLFGNGIDGNVTISINTTLVREMNYNNLTINNGIRLETAGFIVRVRELLTMHEGSIISSNGTSGQTAPSMDIRGLGGISNIISPRYAWQSVPGNGGHGGQQTATGTTNRSGVSGGASFINALQTNNRPIWFMCGAGGGGGGAYGGGTSTLPTTGQSVWMGNPGASGGTSNGTFSTFGSGGGGGSGGGMCMVYTRDISINDLIGNIYIEANGGNGGNGINGGGGGGGGGGGTSMLIYNRNVQPLHRHRTFPLPVLRSSGGIGGNPDGGQAVSGNNIIYQLWHPTLTFSPINVNVPASGGNVFVNITTDPQTLSWLVSRNVPADTWFSIINPTGTGNSVLQLNFSQQSTGNPIRTSSIRIEPTNMIDIPAPINHFLITQDASIVTQAPSIQVSHSGFNQWSTDAYTRWDRLGNICIGSTSIDVSANAPWTSAPGGPNFSIWPTSGPAGVTVVSFANNTFIEQHLEVISLSIGSTQLAFISGDTVFDCVMEQPY